GIAKLLPDDRVDGATLTRAGFHALTTVYASPEQVRGEPIATVSDVYSLGVVLYELLAGRPPFTPEGMTPHELQRRICEDSPARPSVAATTETASTAGLGDASRLRRLLRGELDDIVMMALRKEPERRYTSAEQLSEDLRRYLEHLPVLARRDTFAYRTSKFVQRYRTGVAAAALVAVSLGIGVGAVVTQGRVATRERDRARIAGASAERERVRTQRVSDFLRDMLGAADPSWYATSERPGPRTTVGELLESAGRKVDSDLESEPAVRAAILQTLGRANQTLANFDIAQRQLEGALALNRQQYGERHAEVASDLHELGMLHHQRGQIAKAESTYAQSLEIFRALSDSTSDAYSRTESDLGLALLSRGRAVEAAPLLRSAVAHRRRLDGGASPALAITLGNVALALDVQGKLDEAEMAYRESLATFARLPGRDYFERGFSLHNLAIVRSLRGSTFEAESLMHQASELWTRLLGAGHPRVAVGLAGLARVYFAAGDDRAALRYARQAEAIVQRTLPPAHPDVARVETVYGQALVRTHVLAEGERRLRHALDIRRAALAPNSWHVAETSGALGVALVRRGRYAEAEPLLTASAESLKESVGPSHPRTLEARRNLAALYEAWGRSGRRGVGPKGGLR
ncbi:MAG: tetratricopeptide repeat-containing protein kinase family protein, partial [Gemmatimonadaceae bacterium]|nr:tetratricopeptide repeat-containing protein kinase family protein [Gemmatimonadaceae bacterium]